MPKKVVLLSLCVQIHSSLQLTNRKIVSARCHPTVFASVEIMSVIILFSCMRQKIRIRRRLDNKSQGLNLAAFFNTSGIFIILYKEKVTYFNAEDFSGPSKVFSSCMFSTFVFFKYFLELLGLSFMFIQKNRGSGKVYEDLFFLGVLKN